MNIDIGIIGLAKSGRTTIFNALTKGKADTGAYTREGLAPHVGIARIPEPRLESLTEMLNPKRVVPAEARYVDIGASVKGLAEDKGLSGQVLMQLTSVDALISVVRAFADESVPHIEGSLDTERDIATMDLELTFSDLTILENRLERIKTALKGAKPTERVVILKEEETLKKFKASLEKDIPLRELELTTDEEKTISNYQFLTYKPLLIVVNIGEDQLPQAEALEAELNSRYLKPGRRIITLCGKLEMELAELDEEAAKGFRNEFGLKESGLERTIRESCGLLGLISFFSTASGEVRAWPIKKGTSAPKAAGKIHTDMERGFIRAEVVSYNDLAESGSMAEARKKGLLRQEGKNYIVRDGDVITFLFNV